MINVAVIGARGKMGMLACEAIEAAGDLDLVAAVDIDEGWEALPRAEVAVDFTHPGVVMDNLARCIDHGVHVVVGTSGFTDERLQVLERRLQSSPAVGVLVVPNFSIGAVMMMQFAAQAAPFFESVEVVELHHPTKLDAPSGTALRTAHLIAAARRDAGLAAMPDATTDDEVGARGGRVDDVPVHSIRMRGLIAHQEVLFGNVGETLTLRHDMPDRAASMPGMLASIRYVATHVGLTVGLEPVLGIV